MSSDDTPSAPSPVPPPGGAVQGASSLPVDPLRVLWALRRGWRWIVLGLLAGAGLGLAYGALKTRTRFDVSFQLIKRYSPPVIQAGANGEPFKPRAFNNSTLASAAASLNVLERVARKARPPLSARVLKTQIEVKEDKLTDFVTMKLSGNVSPEATVATARLWADEIIAFTREIQQQESREIRKVIQGQLDANQAELQSIDAKIGELSGGSQFLAADTQAEGFTHTQEALDARYDAARLELDGLTSQLAGLKAELLRHTPAAEELRLARAELNTLLVRYTDTNPIIVERREKVARLEARLKQQQTGPALDVSSLENHSGTAVGDQLYMRMVEVENQRNAAEGRVQVLTRQREIFTKSPEKLSKIMETLQRKQMLRVAQGMLLSRLQEASIYESYAPSYYGVFAPAEIGQVTSSTRTFKTAVLVAGGGVAGTCGALGLVLLLAVADRKLRAPGEAAKALTAPLLAALPAGIDPAAPAGAKLWMRWLGGQTDAKRLRCVWCPVSHPAEEDFWRQMLTQARTLLPGLVVIDGGLDPSPALAELPAVPLREWSHTPPFSLVRAPLVPGTTLAQARDLQYFVESRLAEGVEVWLRLDGPVQEPAVGVLRAAAAPAPLFVVPLHADATGAFLKEQANLLRHVGLAPGGVVAVNDLSA